MYRIVDEGKCRLQEEHLKNIQVNQSGTTHMNQSRMQT